MLWRLVSFGVDLILSTVAEAVGSDWTVDLFAKLLGAMLVIRCLYTILQPSGVTGHL